MKKNPRLIKINGPIHCFGVINIGAKVNSNLMN